MLPRMKRRARIVRFLALVGAALQLASPGFSAIAHGRLARESASGPATHVEATTTANCPVVHSPDCAVCRYLSTSACGTPEPSLVPRREAETARPDDYRRSTWGGPHALPHGRAPPAV
jgi:hypothetical protein